MSRAAARLGAVRAVRSRWPSCAGAVRLAERGQVRASSSTSAAHWSFAVVGALVATPPARQPDRLDPARRSAARAVGSRAGRLRADGRRPGVAVAAWMADWISDALASALLGVGVPPAALPDGRLPSPRWRLVAWLAAGGSCSPCWRSMFGDPARHEAPATWQNPYALPGAAGDAAARDRRRVGGAVHAARRLIGLAAVVGGSGAHAAWSASRSSGSRSRRARCSPRCCSPRSACSPGPTGDLGAVAWRRSSSSAPRPAGRDRHRDPALPALRHRRRHQPHAGLRRADRDARRRRTSALVLLIGARRVGQLEPRDRGLDARGRGAVPPAARAHPGGGRPPLLPPRATTRRARSRRSAAGCATRSTSTRCGAELRGVVQRDGAARARVALAAERAMTALRSPGARSSAILLAAVVLLVLALGHERRRTTSGSAASAASSFAVAARRSRPSARSSSPRPSATRSAGCFCGRAASASPSATSRPGTRDHALYIAERRRCRGTLVATGCGASDRRCVRAARHRAAAVPRRPAAVARAGGRSPGARAGRDRRHRASARPRAGPARRTVRRSSTTRSALPAPSGAAGRAVRPRLAAHALSVGARRAGDRRVRAAGARAASSASSSSGSPSRRRSPASR